RTAKVRVRQANREHEPLKPCLTRTQSGRAGVSTEAMRTALTPGQNVQIGASPPTHARKVRVDGADVCQLVPCSRGSGLARTRVTLAERSHSGRPSGEGRLDEVAGARAPSTRAVVRERINSLGVVMPATIALLCLPVIIDIAP